MARDDEDVWRAIVDNYGERPEIDPDQPSPSEPAPAAPAPAAPASAARTWENPDDDWTSDRFVPPPPPPLPLTPRDRLVAWTGVFGSPAVLLVCLVLGIELPALLAYVLVAGFIGGFVYLVLKMPREPRDPDDDGAVL